MKNFILLILLSFCINTQAKADDNNNNCGKLLINHFDKDDGTYSFSSRNTLEFGNSNDSLAMHLSGSGEEVILEVIILGATKFIESYSKANFFFRNGEVLEATNNGYDNHYSVITISIVEGSENQELMSKLSDQQLESVKVWTSYGSVKVELNQKDSKIFKETFECLIDKLDLKYADRPSITKIEGGISSKYFKINESPNVLFQLLKFDDSISFIFASEDVNSFSRTKILGLLDDGETLVFKNSLNESAKHYIDFLDKAQINNLKKGLNALQIIVEGQDIKEYELNDEDRREFLEVIDCFTK